MIEKPRYPFFLVTAVTKRDRLQAIALRPVEEGLTSLREHAERRLRDFVFPFRSSTETAGEVMRHVASPYAIGVLQSARLSRVRLAEHRGEADDDEVPYVWLFDPDPVLHAASPGWPSIRPDKPVTIRHRDAPPTPFEVEVVGEVGKWRWSQDSS
ncbi:hypothetical protein [Microcystis phage Mwe-JY26]